MHGAIKRFRREIGCLIPRETSSALFGNTRMSLLFRSWHHGLFDHGIRESANIIGFE